MSFWGTSFFTSNLSRRTSIFNLRLYAFIAICIGVSVALFLLLLSLFFAVRRRRVASLPSPPSFSSSRKPLKLFLSDSTPAVSKEVGIEVAIRRDESRLVEAVQAKELAPRPEVSDLGWGCWYTLREMEAATGGFAKENVIGEGGYGIVYRGVMDDGMIIAIKNLLNNRFWVNFLA